jgi:hypothetical protein
MDQRGDDSRVRTSGPVNRPAGIGVRAFRAMIAFGVIGVGWGWAVSSTRATEPPPMTFSNQVVRVFQDRCQSCHHDGGIAPFSLEHYAEAASFASLVRYSVAERYMPPWPPRADCGGGFLHDRSLSDAEMQTIIQWVDGGAPEGDPADMPPPLTFPVLWQAGEPDVAYPNAKGGYDVPDSSDGKYDRFRCFSIPTGFEVDRYITGFEVLRTPGVKIHHALLYLDVDGKSVALDQAQPGPGYDNLSGPGFDAPLLGGWNPGAPPVFLPAGTGIRIPAGSHLVLQIHYASIDTPQHDRTQLGLHFARTPVHKSRFTIVPKNEHFLIPAGDPHYRVDAETTLAEDVTVLSVAPHMHKIGKDMQVTAILPNGDTQCLIGVNWNIEWQGSYTYKEAVPLPAGTRVHITSYYDNSADNPKNPNSPPIDVPWFPTEDTEMCFCTLGVTSDAEHLDVSAPALSTVKLKRNGRLVATGTDVRAGAYLLVNDVLVRDSKAFADRGRVASAKAWKRLVPKGVPVTVSILNPDGASAPPVTFTR